MGATTLSVEEALAELQRVSPDAPFLALGQTVFWDEPMKAGLALTSKRLGHPRRLVAGVHDTDYFAKLPSGIAANGRYKAVPHNDTTTKGLWSAAGEFSTLFGSETVVTRETLTQAGLRIHKISSVRPGLLDEATEAWGWKGIVSSDENPPVTAEVPLKPLLNELRATFDWALDQSLGCIAGDGRQTAETLADELRTALCDAAEQESLLGEFYKRLLPRFYEFCAGAPIDLEVTATTELLRFNTLTCGQPRFEILQPFVDWRTREAAADAYDQAIQGSSLYELARFGTGAVPFDLVIPGKGRGTLRIGHRGIVISTPEPQFVSLRKPIESVADLAEAIEKKFGPNCVLVGKAVTLIGMLSREFVFVFHEGASSYVKHSRSLHERLAQAGFKYAFNPILRIRYNAWDALQVCCSWLRLPEPFQRPFGTEEMCAPSFAGRWRGVAEEQEGLLRRLGELRRPIDLIRFLDATLGGSWNCLANEYESLHRRLQALEKDVDEIKRERIALYAELDALTAERLEAERAKGDQFRAAIFEKQPTAEDLQERERLTHRVESVIHKITAARARLHDARKRQDEVVADPEIKRIHERRRSIELEAELKRLRLIRHAVISSRGLQHANYRPSAWWFRLICPDGLWFRETVNSAEYYLEPLGG